MPRLEVGDRVRLWIEIVSSDFDPIEGQYVKHVEVPLKAWGEIVEIRGSSNCRDGPVQKYFVDFGCFGVWKLDSSRAHYLEPTLREASTPC